MTSAIVAALVLIVGVSAPAFASATTAQVLVVVALGGGRVTSQPAGIACPNKCKATFPQGTSVQLTPTTANGSSFEAWGGSCTGSGQCTVKMTSLAAVAAQFSPAPPVHAAEAVAVPGSYAGSGLSFWIEPGGRSMVNVVGPQYVNLQCTPSGGTQHPFEMLRVPVAPNGSFHTSATDNAIVIPSGSTAGVAVKIIYSISGNLQPATANSAAEATGTWRETLTSTGPSMRSCDSNSHSWSATLTAGPGPSKQMVQSGNYAGPVIKFSVNSGQNRMLNVASGSALAVYCPGPASITNPFQMAQVAIKADGSFSARATTHGMVTLSGTTAGVSATITYTLAGYFEGVTSSSNAVTVGGVLREDITLANGAVQTCTSNNRTWSATLS